MGVRNLPRVFTQSPVFREIFFQGRQVTKVDGVILSQNSSAVFNLDGFSEVWYTLAVMSTVFATPIHDDYTTKISEPGCCVIVWGLLLYAFHMCKIIQLPNRTTGDW